MACPNANLAKEILSIYGKNGKLQSVTLQKAELSTPSICAEGFMLPEI
jgi:hypothetical protein